MDSELLMEMQYNFPLSTEPFDELAERLERSEKAIINEIKRLRKRGTVKRLGAQLNYKALSDAKVAALVGAEVEKKRIGIVARRVNALGVRHNFLREHETYNVWYTIKASTREELASKVKLLMEKSRVSNYVVLPSKRVYKMDVKYDIEGGISWSDRGLEPEEVPLMDELGVDLRLLKDLESKFRVVNKPFRSIARRHNTSENEIVELLMKLIGERAVRDFGAVLDSRKIGFRENCMVMLDIRPGKEQGFCLELLKRYPQITHLVERYAPAGWKYPVYFMVHAREKDPIDSIIEEVSGMEGVREARGLYSTKDLKAR